MTAHLADELSYFVGERWGEMINKTDKNRLYVVTKREKICCRSRAMSVNHHARKYKIITLSTINFSKIRTKRL